MSGIASFCKSVIGAGAALITMVAVGHAAGPIPTLPAHGLWAPTALEILAQPIGDSRPNAAQLRHGQYLVVVGDCMACHLREGGEPFAGGLAIRTPFGVIYSANITPDRETGIGAWTDEQFYHAMHDGVGAQGKNLYPAFPYPWYRRASRQDDDAIIAYLRTTPAVHYTPPQNDLPFPLNIRSLMKVWNLLFLTSGDIQADPRQSTVWNRGAYLVKGLGHCGGCHSPRNLLGAEKADEPFHGARLDNWVAPDLTRNDRTGLGRWSVDDVAEYLRNGRSAHAGAGGAMADVVTYSTSLMSDDDRHAIAVYLKSQPTTAGISQAKVDPGAMRRGAAIYSDACAACHLDDGAGQPRLFPPLRDNAMLQQADSTGLAHLILAGGRTGTSPSRPSPLSMPSFAWKLSDGEVADVATFLRNSWGNGAPGLSASQVQEVRRQLKLQSPHLTVNSGEQD